MSIRDTYITKLKLQLEELTTTMLELRSTTETAKIGLDEKYLKEMNSLREQSQSAIAKLDELKTTSEYSWKNLVADAEKVSNAFVKASHNFKSQL